VFFSAPHTPYAAPSPHWKRWTNPHYDGPYRYLKQPLPQLAVLPAAEAQQIRGLYDGAVSSVDAAISRLLEEVGDETTIVLVGDHGENLFDLAGRGMGHGDHLWGDVGNHVPLVIADERIGPRDVMDLVRDVDVAPTLGALAGVAAPPGDGVDLTPLLEGKKDTLSLESYQETGLWLLAHGPGYRTEDRLPYPDLWHATTTAPDGDLFLKPELEDVTTNAKHRALRTRRWKLVYQPAQAGTFWRLFDLTKDRMQRKDVAADNPAVVKELQPKLQRWISDGQAATSR
jgi:arylsulfatase A-like enzyme